ACRRALRSRGRAPPVCGNCRNRPARADRDHARGGAPLEDAPSRMAHRRPGDPCFAPLNPCLFTGPSFSFCKTPHYEGHEALIHFLSSFILRGETLLLRPFPLCFLELGIDHVIAATR